MRSSQTSSAEHGFSLIELLIATTVASVVLATTGAFFVASRNFIQQETLVVETTQALRATLDSLERDLRLGGACLPTIGDFVALSGADNGTTDTIVTRTGLVTANLTCVRTALAVAVGVGVSTLPLITDPGFSVGMRAYIRNANNGTGEFFTVTDVQPNDSMPMLQKDGPSSQDYPVASGVYGIDERTYAIDTSNPGLPVLILTANNGSPFQFASGIESFDVKYTLARNFQPVVDLPASTAEWRLVNEVSVTVIARSRVPGIDGQYYRRTGAVTLQPRNLMPGSTVLGS